MLRDLGCEVGVYERSTAELEARGAGIGLLDMTTRYFRERGLLDVEEVSVAIHWVRYLHPDGSTRFEEPRRYVLSSWNTIYRALLAELGPDRYHLGWELTGLDQAGDRATARFADGRAVQADLLVCADGVASTARALLQPEAAATYAGYVAWRGTVPESSLSPGAFAALRDALTFQQFPNSHILVYPIPSLAGDLEPGRRLQNFVWYRNYAPGADLDDLMTGRDGVRRETSLPPGAAPEHHVAEMREFAARHMAPPIREVVLGAEQPFVQVIYDVAVQRMAFGRVCLIGDAAFAVRPHAAAGTAKAAADGWVLAETLAAAEGDVAVALAEWERRQLELGRSLLARTRDVGDRSQFHGTWVPGDPDLVFGLYAPGR